MSFLPGQFVEVGGGRSLPLTAYSKSIMLSPHDKNVGALPFGTNKLARWVQKKLAGRPRGAESIVMKTGSPHLLKNGHKQGYFDYTAYQKYHSAGSQPTGREPENGPAVEPEERRILRRRSSKGKSPELPHHASTTYSRMVEERTPPPSPESPKGIMVPKRAPPVVGAQPPDPKPSRARQAVDVLRADRAEVESKLGDLGGGPAVAMAGLESVKGQTDPEARKLESELIMEMLLHELPGLDIQQPDKPNQESIKPTVRQIGDAKERYAERIRRLKSDRQALRDARADGKLDLETGPKLIADVTAEIERCRECLRILQSYPLPSKSDPPTSRYWITHLYARWGARRDLFEIVRELRDLDAIERQCKFVFLPQEACLIELMIATEELLDIHHSGVLTTQQFGELVQALARGWPGVKEDSESPLPESRANAAGCVRSLAQLANKGRLPREVLAIIPDYDPINKALLIRAQEREMGGKFAELFEAQKELLMLEPSDQGSKKERERLAARIKTLKDEIAQIDPDFDRDIKVAELTKEEIVSGVLAMRNAGRKLGAKYAELMAAERSLRAAGVDIRGVRIDRHFVHGLDKKEPKLRRRIALLLFRVATIEEEIAKLNPRFQRRLQRSELNEQEDRNFRQLRSPIGVPGASARVEGNVLTAKGWQVPDELLDYGLTAEDLSDMGLPATTGPLDRKEKDRRKGTLGNLASMGMSNADEVKLQNQMHQRIRKHLFNTKAGRSAARSAFGMTTAQLSAEYLGLVFRSVTGKHDKLGHAEVKTDMIAHWGKIMKLSTSDKAVIARTSDGIRAKRAAILGNMAKLARPDGHAARIESDIRRDHEDCVKMIKFIGTALGEKRCTFVYAMIRAAVLSARPQRAAGEDIHFESIDLYDASRYRKEIYDILASWGMDTDLYQVLIDHVVFSRAEDSELAPGTVTAPKLARWKAVLEQRNPFGATAQRKEMETAEQRSLKQRAKQLAIDSAKAVAGYFSGREFDPMNPEDVQQILDSLPAISNCGKISLRTHTLVHSGVEIAPGIGFSIPLELGGGDQLGVVFKRVDDWMDVRLMWGGVGNGLLGLGGSAPASAGAGFKNRGAGNHSRWDTSGVELRLPIERDPVTGEENFDKVKSYVRALLTGERLSTGDWANADFKWRGIRKRGWHVKGGSANTGTFGAEADAVIGKASAGVHLAGAGETRFRERTGEHWNAEGSKRVDKWTLNSTTSVSARAGVNLGYEEAAGGNVSEVAPGITTPNIAGVSAGVSVTTLTNIARYQAGTKYGKKLDWDFIVDVGSVASAEEAFDKCGPDIAKSFRPLLDKKVRLDNGDEVTFRDEIERALKLMQMNDGFLLQFVPRPAVEEDVNRRMRRIAQITDQILPAMVPAKADRNDPVKKRKLEQERKRLLEEIDRELAFIRQAGDPAKMENFMPSGVWIMPLSTQTEEWTVLNLLGLLKVSHVGVRQQDAMFVHIPAPKEEDRTALEIARDGLDRLVAERAAAIPPGTPVLSSPTGNFGRALDELDRTLDFLRKPPALASRDFESSEPGSEASTTDSLTDEEDVVFETPPGSSPSSRSTSPADAREELTPPNAYRRFGGYQSFPRLSWLRSDSSNEISPLIQPGRIGNGQ